MLREPSSARWMLLLAALGAGCGPLVHTPEPPTPVVYVITVPSSALPAITSGPFGAGQVWSGHYDCPQGDTALRLIVLDAHRYQLRAIFDFFHEPSGAKGAYVIDGSLDPRTGRVFFKPVAWVVRPEGYVMVGMSGTVSGDGIMGRITDPACGDFEVELEPHGARPVESTPP